MALSHPSVPLRLAGAFVFIFACVSVAVLLAPMDASFAREEDGGSAAVHVTD